MKSLCSLSDENSVSFRLSDWGHHSEKLKNNVIKKVDFLKGYLTESYNLHGSYLYASVSVLKQLE